jgi:tRNA pseudouridine(55) synthase
LVDVYKFTCHCDSVKKYVVLNKQVGETPLACVEAWRNNHPTYSEVPLAYAGRLDPMASGKLLVLIGEECKNQESYHGLDKAYNFSVLFGITSDTQDVLGRLTTCSDTVINQSSLNEIATKFVGTISLPYPIFSSKTVNGKPLHTWTLEGRLDEITIPTKRSIIYDLSVNRKVLVSREELVATALDKINSIPPVTDKRKAIGNDFRRAEVRQDWNEILKNDSLPDVYTVAHFTCIATSGTYMRTLASEIAKKINSCGLAWSIHRTTIGNYQPTEKKWLVDYR